MEELESSGAHLYFESHSYDADHAAEERLDDDRHGPRRTGCLRKLGDFNNIVKAFIGSNYLSMPFGFFQSGLVLGCIILVLIVAITDHCCQLIIKCKKILVDDLVEKFEEETSHEDDGSYRQRLQRDLRYADIGRLCFGKAGVVIVDIFLMITQIGFCLTYFIFIGNTIHAMFPLKEITVQLIYPWQNVTINDTLSQPDYYYFNTNGNPVNGYSSIDSFLGKNHLTSDMMELSGVNGPSAAASHLLLTLGENGSTLEPTTTGYWTTVSANEMTTLTTGLSTSTAASHGTTTTRNKTTATASTSTPGNMTTATPFINTTTVPPTNESLIPANNTSDHVFISSAPDLKWLVLVPLLPFILFAYIRNIRKMASISLMANMGVFIGFFVILIYMLIGFRVDPGVENFSWKFPVFFGQVACAFEGIGLVLPVEASMEENRKKFPAYLHGALFMVSCVFTLFGVIGYLRYGPHVQQVIIKNLPPFSVLSMCIDACLILAIACTYPLQVFPVMEILEKYVFKIGHIQKAGDHSGHIQDDDDDDEPEFDKDSDETTTLLPPQPKEVPTWKRNILRTIVVLVIAGLSVLLRDNFAYIAAFVGSCGSTALGYVLPCLFHMKLKGHQLHPVIIIKNVVIVIIGIIGGGCGVVLTVMQIIDSFTQG